MNNILSPITQSHYSTVFVEDTDVNLSIYSFLDTAGGCSGLPVMGKISMLRVLCQHGSAPFYLSDLFHDDRGVLGGWIKTLRTYHIVRPTGNRREVQFVVDTWHNGEEVRTGYAKEWELCVPAEDIRSALETIRNFYFGNL